MGHKEMYRKGTAFERCWNKFLVDDGCWPWIAGVDADGYGRIGYSQGKGLPTKAHVVIWTALRGPVPEGMELDHLCRNKRCVNPAHLEPVTHAVNCQRRLQYQAQITHCPQGHPYDEENTYLYRGMRACRLCARERGRVYDLKRRGRRRAQD